MVKQLMKKYLGEKTETKLSEALKKLIAEFSCGFLGKNTENSESGHPESPSIFEMKISRMQVYSVTGRIT
jgi:hypothetical protein